MTHLPQYQIYGPARRALKKEWANLKHYLSNLRRSARLDNDMARFLNCPEEIETQEQIDVRYNAAAAELAEIYARLAVPYCEQAVISDSKPA